MALVVEQTREWRAGDGGANQGGREGEKQSGVGITRSNSSRKLKGDNTKDTVGMGNIKWVNTRMQWWGVLASWWRR